MAKGFNELLGTLRDLIETSKQSSSENASISHELSTTAMGVGENVEKSVVVIDDATKKQVKSKTKSKSPSMKRQRVKKRLSRQMRT